MALHLSPAEARRFSLLLQGWSDTEQAQQMRQYCQHGRISTYDHCISVARTSFWLNRRLHLGGDEAILVRGAFLHDFYLYDWHDCSDICRWHGFVHPAIALRNADARYALNDRERNIIASHMWPLTLRHVPRCREAAVVCLSDKTCSLRETLFCR